MIKSFFENTVPSEGAISKEQFEAIAKPLTLSNKEADEACQPCDSSSVSHPKHYNSGKIEVIEAIEDWNLNFHRGNTVKYVARAGKKDPSKEIEDLEKAAWYLNREIEVLKSKKEKREAIRPNDMVKRGSV